MLDKQLLKSLKMNILQGGGEVKMRIPDSDPTHSGNYVAFQQYKSQDFIGILKMQGFIFPNTMVVVGGDYIAVRKNS